MFERILVANDGSPHARKALEKAVELAKLTGAELHMICVEEHLPHYAATVGEVLEEQADEDRYFTQVVRDAERLAAEHGVQLHSLITPGHEVETVVKYVEQIRADLLVLGFMGHSRVLGRIMGSTAGNLTRLAPCSVLLIK